MVYHITGYYAGYYSGSSCAFHFGIRKAKKAHIAMYQFDTPFHDIPGCQIFYRKSPFSESEVIADLYENGKFKMCVRVTDRYRGKLNLTHEEVVQDLEMRLLQKRLEDIDFLNDV